MDDSKPCQAAFGLVHLTPSSSAYIENMWAWTADHNLDGEGGQTIAVGRGFLVESTSGTWLHGTASEHNTLYQYNFQNASNVFVGMQQSETAYWQGDGAPALAPAPWTPDAAYGDPTFAKCQDDNALCRMGWFAIMKGCRDMFFYGSGFWSFFSHGDNSCEASGLCQKNAISVRNTSGLNWFGLHVMANVNVLKQDGHTAIAAADSDGGAGAFIRSAIIGAFFLADDNDTDVGAMSTETSANTSVKSTTLASASTDVSSLPTTSQTGTSTHATRRTTRPTNSSSTSARWGNSTSFQTPTKSTSTQASQTNQTPASSSMVAKRYEQAVYWVSLHEYAHTCRPQPM